MVENGKRVFIQEAKFGNNISVRLADDCSVVSVNEPRQGVVLGLVGCFAVELILTSIVKIDRDISR